MTETIEIRPQPGPQTAFLSTSADIAIYGGSAGGGKTYAQLLEPLRHIHNPKFGAVTFRRILPSIKIEGGMWDESFNIYPHLGGTDRVGDLAWGFPSGAKITFAGMQHDSDKMKYQGAQIPLIQFDQLEEFLKSQFFFMLSRNRSASGVKGYMRGTANPQPGWLAKFLDWWIADDGYADMSRAGVIRWFVDTGDTMEWADTPEELSKFKMHGQPIPPKSVTFIPATIYDNKILLEKDPTYLSNLMALPLIERQRLLGDKERGGNWKVVPEAGLLYNRAWYEIKRAMPDRGSDCLFWDLAATAKDYKKSNDPSYTAGVCIRQLKGEYCIHHVYAEQIGPAEVERQFVNLSKQLAAKAKDQGAKFMVRWEEEPGSASKRESRRLAQLLDGIDAKGIRSTKDKITDGRAFSSQSEVGNVFLLEGRWNERWLDHMHNMPDTKHNDIHDATVKGYNELSNNTGGRVKVTSRNTIKGKKKTRSVPHG